MTREEARQLCITDPFFLGDVLGYTFQRDVHAEFFDLLLSDSPKALLLAPRGHYKTSCAAVYVVQRILQNPDVRIILMSATLKLTKNLLSEIRSHFDSRNPKSKLPTLFAEYCTNGKTGTELSWTCPARKRKHLKEPTCWVASQRSTQTGQHADLIVGDDLVHSSNWKSVDLMDKLETDFWHLFPLLDPGGKVRVSGTRYSWADLYQRILTKDVGVNEWKVIIRSCYKADGSLLFPERLTKDGRKIGFTHELLDSIKRDDYQVFTSQYKNEIVATGDQLFPQSLLLKATKSKADPYYPANAPCVFAIDLAQTATKVSDNSAIAVGRADASGRIWVEDVVAGQFSPFVLAQTVVGLYLKYKPVRIWIEQASGAEYFSEFLRVIAREKGVILPIDFIKASRQRDAKYLNIAQLEGPLKNGRLILLAGATDYQATVTEMEQFPKGRNDDRPDCIAMLYRSLAANVSYTPQPLKKLPYFFDVPHSTESPRTDGACILGDGFCC